MNNPYGSKFPSFFSGDYLSNLCKGNNGIQTGPFGSLLHKEDYVEFGTPIITVEHLGDNGKISRNNLPLVSEDDKKRLSKFLLRKDDVIFSRVGSVDRNALVTQDEDGWLFSGRCLRVRPDTNKINAAYLSFFFSLNQFKHFISRMAVGGTMPSLNTQILSKIPIFYPPLPEQRKIAEILSTWDEAITIMERLIAALQTRKKGLMQRLLNGQVRFPGFDREWKESKLEECCDILDNQRIPLNNDERVNRQGNIPYYGANGILDYIDDNIFDEPLILIAEDGGYFDEASFRPICQLIDGKSWVNNHAHVLRAKPGNVREWIYYWFVHRNIVPYINGGTRSKLNQKDLRTLPIKLPTYDEQLKVSSFLKECDQEIKLHNEILSIYNSQKKGLMQRLLTGQVRVKLEQ